MKATCCSAEVGEYKVPIVIVFYHESLSEPAPGGEEDEKLLSLLVVEVVVRVHTQEVRNMLPLLPYVAKYSRVEQWRTRWASFYYECSAHLTPATSGRLYQARPPRQSSRRRLTSW